MEPGNGFEIASFTVTLGIAAILLAVFHVGSAAFR